MSVIKIVVRLQFIKRYLKILVLLPIAAIRATSKTFTPTNVPNFSVFNINSLSMKSFLQHLLHGGSNF